MLTYQEKASFLEGNQPAKHFANLKSGAITPLIKGGFIHLFKIRETLGSSRIEDLLGVTTRGNKDFIEVTTRGGIEFLDSIKKGSYLATQFCQFLGSMPRLCNSFLIIRLIQADTDASPSCSRAVFIPFSSAGSTRSAICLFPLLVILVVDTCHTPFYILTVNQVYDTRKIKTTPSNDITSTKRGLITTDSIIIEVTMSKHNTPVTGRTSLTPNQSYRWLFLALNRSDYTAKPCRITVTAPNENSARLMLVRDYMLIFAGRLPAIGGKHHA
ncbi:host cell division inhibitor Icd-like protein [Providencia rettgeri]|uniref:host cell division inhibitor Icd-like protein n=1 Tax=Providencia rettgeri TaxID=587 RepID=UPI003AF32C68